MPVAAAIGVPAGRTWPTEVEATLAARHTQQRPDRPGTEFGAKKRPVQFSASARRPTAAKIITNAIVQSASGTLAIMMRQDRPRSLRSRSRSCPVADKVSQSQGFWAIRLFGLSKLGHCVTRLSCIAEGAAGISPGALGGSGSPLW
jgi:hypothetical protein